jgi:uncharacterized membrane protein
LIPSKKYCPISFVKNSAYSRAGGTLIKGGNMPDVIKETITTSENNNTPKKESSKRDATSYQTAGYLVYFVFGLLDILLGFRFVFKLFGANPSTSFVDFIYNLSAIFVAPFAGIFNTSLAQGDVTTSIFEPATLVALVFYAILAWVIVALIRVISGRQQTE